jgi:hypothetical protein
VSSLEGFDGELAVLGDYVRVFVLLSEGNENLEVDDVVIHE